MRVKGKKITIIVEDGEVVLTVEEQSENQKVVFLKGEGRGKDVSHE